MPFIDHPHLILQDLKDSMEHARAAKASGIFPQYAELLNCMVQNLPELVRTLEVIADHQEDYIPELIRELDEIIDDHEEDYLPEVIQELDEIIDDMDRSDP